MSLHRWKPATGLLPVLAGLLVFSGGCGIRTNIGGADDDDTTPEEPTFEPGDDDSGDDDSGDDDSGDDDSGDDDDTAPGDDDDEPTDHCGGDAANCVDGREDGHAFGEVGAAIFSYPANPEGGESPVVVLTDYTYSCAQLQSRPPTGPQIPATANANTVVGVVNFMLGEYDDTVGGVLGTTETGSYRVIQSQRGLEEGEQVAYGSVYFLNGAGTVEVIEDAVGGTVEVDEADMSAQMAGSFELILESGSSFIGRFDTTPCELPPYHGGSG